MTALKRLNDDDILLVTGGGGGIIQPSVCSCTCSANGNSAMCLPSGTVSGDVQND